MMPDEITADILKTHNVPSTGRLKDYVWFRAKYAEIFSPFSISACSSLHLSALHPFVFTFLQHQQHLLADL